MELLTLLIAFVKSLWLLALAIGFLQLWRCGKPTLKDGCTKASNGSVDGRKVNNVTVDNTANGVNQNGCCGQSKPTPPALTGGQVGMGACIRLLDA